MELKRMAESLNSAFLRKKAKQLLAVLLAVMMVIPVTGYGVVAHAQETKTITAFAHLAEEAKTITVQTGALEEELPLPELLTATVERIVYEETTAGSSNPAQEESKETEPTEPTEGGSAEGTESKTEPVAKKVTEDVALAVTWESDKPFSSEAADTFTYTAKVTEESYALAESVSLPQIQVQIADGGTGAFNQRQTIDGIEITVNAEKGVFPEGAVLHAEKVTNAGDKAKIENVVSQEVKAKDTAKIVTQVVSFDITITDADGNELQPDTSKGEVKVSFAKISMTKNEIIEDHTIQVFHMNDTLSNAEELESIVDDKGVVEAVAEHFSVYAITETINTPDTDTMTTLYINKGNITIGDGTVSGFDASGAEVTTANSNGYIITRQDINSSVNKYTITVTSGTHNIVLKDVSLYLDPDITSSPFSIASGAKVNLVLEGTNYLRNRSTLTPAGLHVPEGAELVIAKGSTGSITALAGPGAGIGGNDTEAGGTITINGGSINASGGTSGAGIGGGRGGAGGIITINGGTIADAQSSTGAGIGGGAAGGAGGIITINGGTTNARSGLDGAGIGGGENGAGGSISINGGIVKAIGGSSGAGIGGGSSGDGGTIAISNGEVTATSFQGAGIGGGAYGFNHTGGTITISGGTVSATTTNSEYGVGIGNGFRGGDNGGTLSSGGNSVYVNANRVNADTSSFNGVIDNDGNTTVYGTYALTGNMTIAAEKTMTISNGSSLIVPSDKTLTVNGALINNGTLSLGAESCLVGADNTLSGQGTFKTMGDPTSDMIVVPTNLIYTGTDLAETAKSAISIDTTQTGTATILNQEFQVIANSADGWVLSLNPAVVKAAGIYTAIFTKGSKTIHKEFTVNQSATTFDGGGITVDKTDKTYTYGDTITVTAKPKATGTAPKARMAFVAPAENQMALFVGETQISDSVDGDSNGVYTMTYDTTDKALAIGSNTITAKYVGNANMADFSTDVSVTLNKKALTVIATGSRTYDGTNSLLPEFSQTFGLKGILGSDKVAALVSGTVPDANVGTDKVFTAKTVEMRGVDKDFYSLALKDINYTVEITKKLLTSDMMENVDDVTYNGTQHQPTLVVTDGAPDTIKPSDYTVSYGENINAGPGTVTITATESGNYYGETYQAFTIRKAVPTVTLEVITYEGVPYVYGNLIYFTAVVTGVNGEKPDGTVTFKDGNETLFSDVAFSTHSQFYQTSSDSVAAGNHSFTAVYTPSTDGTGKNYVGVTSAVVEQTIAKEDQSISITEVNGKKYKGADFTLETTGGKGTGAVTFSVPVDNGVLSVDGNTATIIGAGTVLVTATKAADTNYNSITTTREITIGKAAAPAITFPTSASSVTYGQPLSASMLTGGSTEFGSFAWADGNTIPTVINSGYPVKFTASKDTIKNYETITPNTDTVVVAVAKATPAVSVSATVSGEPGSRQAVLTAAVAAVGEGILPTGTVKFVDSTDGSGVDIPGGMVTITNGVASYTWSGLLDQVYKVKVVYVGDPNYETSASSELEFDTRKQAQQNFAISAIGAKTYGDGAFTLSTTGGNGAGAVSFTSSDTSVIRIDGTKATILKAGKAKITAKKAEDSTYNEAVAEISIPVAKKAVTVTAEDKTVVKGNAMPSFTYQTNGLVNGDTFITEPTMTTNATDTNTLGEYKIAISGGTLSNVDNYSVTYTSGRLTVINQMYTVTVTNGTGGGSYSEGQIVTITADSRSGYTFTGWSSSDGITFTSSTASTTTFPMPGKAVTVTANYSKNSSGGSSGGGGGGGSSTTSPSTSTDSSKPTTSGNTTSVSTKTKANMTGSTAIATVSESSMNTAIDSAITAATKANGNANVTVAVEAAKDAKTIKASIPASSITKLADNKTEASLTVETGLGTIAMESSVVDTISKQANGKPVSVEIAKVDNKTLSAGQQAIVGDRPVIDLSIVADGKNVSQLGGSATISIPYTPANGEDTSKIVVWYLADNGDLTLMDCSYSNGKLSFTTNHFSKYVLASYTFTDAKGGEWYYSAVKTMQDKGLMNGLSSNTFGANMSTNRAMIVTMLYRLAGKPAASTTSVYTDVSADAYYGNAVKWAAEKSIVKGMSAETFAPNMAISREQIVTILYRYAGSPAITGSELSKFADASSVSAYATDAFAWAIQAGVIKGDNNGLLNPTMGATRAEVATMFSNYLNIGK